MYDYAQVQLLGRATSNAEFGSFDEDDRPGKATFTLALNIPVKRSQQIQTKTVYRRVMVLGAFAGYVQSCQEEDGLKGRLINVLGVMDDERYYDDGIESFREVTRVAPGAGVIKIMDRRSRNDG